MIGASPKRPVHGDGLLDPYVVSRIELVVTRERVRVDRVRLIVHLRQSRAPMSVALERAPALARRMPFHEPFVDRAHGA